MAPNPEISTVPIPLPAHTTFPYKPAPPSRNFFHARPPSLLVRTARYQLVRASGIIVAAGRKVAVSVLRLEDVLQRELVLGTGRQITFLQTARPRAPRPPLQSPLTPPPERNRARLVDRNSHYRFHQPLPLSLAI